MRITDMYELDMESDRVINHLDSVQKYVDEITDEIFESGNDIISAALYVGRFNDYFYGSLNSIEEITCELVRWLNEYHGFDSVKIVCNVNDKTIIFDTLKL